jgi:hypothetical protein
LCSFNLEIARKGTMHQQKIDQLETRLWQGGFRFIAGRDGEFYALSIYENDEADTVRISPLVLAFRAGRMTLGRVVAECCRLIGLPEFDLTDRTGAAGSDA